MLYFLPCRGFSKVCLMQHALQHAGRGKSPISIAFFAASNNDEFWHHINQKQTPATVSPLSTAMLALVTVSWLQCTMNTCQIVMVTRRCVSRHFPKGFRLFVTNWPVFNHVGDQVKHCTAFLTVSCDCFRSRNHTFIVVLLFFLGVGSYSLQHTNCWGHKKHRALAPVFTPTVQNPPNCLSTRSGAIIWEFGRHALLSFRLETQRPLSQPVLK